MIEKYIKYMRNSAGLSQITLSEKLGIAQTTLSGYETGNSKPNYETVHRIAKICDFDVLIKDKNSSEVITITFLS